MGKKKFAFVILHYNSIEDSLECVDSINEMCSGFDYHIYLVDNNSPNGSGVVLAEKYKRQSTISIILSEKNLGFAKGNNLGIHQAVRDGYSDFVIVMNNDTKVRQSDFCSIIENEFSHSNFAVLGPTIYTPSGKTSINPGRKTVLRGRELDRMEKAYAGKLTLLKLHLQWISRLYKYIHLSVKKVPTSEKEYLHTEHCLLHGCCLVFSKNYLALMEGFDSRTFLYFEEDILFAHCEGLGLKMVYCPDLEIYHKEDGATDSILPKPREKDIFVISHILKSIKVYRTVLAERGLA